MRRMLTGLLMTILTLAIVLGLLMATGNAAGESFTIHVWVDASWKEPAVWAWDGEGSVLPGDWPGPRLETRPDGWYSISVPGSTEGICITANDGAIGTADIPIELKTLWIRIEADGAYALSYDGPDAPEDTLIYGGAYVPPGNNPNAQDIDENSYSGTYEGERDADGQRSGYGVWTYLNHRYEGQWANDKPNGEGVLYSGYDFDGDGKWDTGVVAQGNWVDGYADGEVLWSWHYGDGEEFWGDGSVWLLSLKNGYSQGEFDVTGVSIQGEQITGEHKFHLRPDAVYAGVPPWAVGEHYFELAYANKNFYPPMAGAIALPSWSMTAYMGETTQSAAGGFMGYEGWTNMLPDDRTVQIEHYEGEYDTDGKRSGYGVWTHYNHRYEGQWENDLPNGEGVLYSGLDYNWNGQQDVGVVTQSHWVDGYAEGEALFYIQYEQGVSSVMLIPEMKKGCPVISTTLRAVSRQGEEITEWYTDSVSKKLYAAVPPWAEGTYYYDESPYVVENFFPPTHGSILLPSWELADSLKEATRAYRLEQSGRAVQTERYEGEYDADGKRSGFGIWEHHNFRYEGQWENDMPNGEGILYRQRDDYSGVVCIVQGNWVNGLANGMITYNELDEYEYGATGRASPNYTEARAYQIEVKDGHPLQDETLYDHTEEKNALEVRAADFMAGVLPWADVAYNAAPAPVGRNFEDEPKGRTVGEYGSNWLAAVGDNRELIVQDGWVWLTDVARYMENSGRIKIAADGSAAHLMDYDPNYPPLKTWYLDYETDQTIDGLGGIRTRGKVVYLERTGDSYDEYQYKLAYMDDNPYLTGKTVIMELPKQEYELLYADDEWVYYLSGKDFMGRNDGRVFRVRLDGSGNSVVVPNGEIWQGTFKGSYVGDYVYYIEPYESILMRRRLDGEGKGKAEVLIPGYYDGIMDLVAHDGCFYFICDGLRYGGMVDNPFYNTGDIYIGKLRIEDLVAGVSQEELFAKTERYTIGKRPPEYPMRFHAAYDWLYLRSYIGTGENTGEWILIRTDFSEQKKLVDITLLPDGSMPPQPVAEAEDAHSAVKSTQLPLEWEGWKAPTPLGEPVFLGTGNTEGNLAMRGAYGMAELGEWIFLRVADKDGMFTLFKMSADGSVMLKMAELAKGEILFPLQVVGDWLYTGIATPVADSPTGEYQEQVYKAQRNDVALTPTEDAFPQVYLKNGWDYTFRTATENGQGRKVAVRTRLDGSDETTLGILTQYDSCAYYTMTVLFADNDWVYVYTTGYQTVIDEKLSGYFGEITKVKNDGSGEAFTYMLPEQFSDVTEAHIAGGKLFFITPLRDEGTFALQSVDLDFAQKPITILEKSVTQMITSFHATNDYIYYSNMYPQKDKMLAAITRMNLDGSDPLKLADGFEGTLFDYTIAGDWMLIKGFVKDVPTPYLMRLDGTGLHKLGEPYVPEDAPGITDSTGKWRYELLPDGSAMILGSGSKLKQTGKLAIPTQIDKIPVTAIGANAFYGCDGFSSVTIPKSVTSIGDFAFFFCKGLTGVAIPEGVTSIGEGAFGWCEGIKKVSLPASLTSIGTGVFTNCPDVSLSVAKKNETFEIRDGALFDKVQNLIVE